MIDLHIHILPGIDDGPADIAASLQLARVCVAEGTEAVVATPHVSERHDNRPAAIREGLKALRLALAEEGIELAVHSGAEVAIDQLDVLDDDEIRALALGGGSTILLETPYAGWPMGLERHTVRLAELGVRVLLAHPERSAGLRTAGGVELLRTAVERGVYVQLTAGSLTGRFGRDIQKTARGLLDAGLVHILAGDAHDAHRRPPLMREAAEAIGDAELASWLTVDAPRALLAGERLPTRPVNATRRRGLRGFRRH